MTHSLMIAGIKLLEGLFAVGLFGSVILIVLTSIEDFREVFTSGGEDERELLTD